MKLRTYIMDLLKTNTLNKSSEYDSRVYESKNIHICIKRVSISSNLLNKYKYSNLAHQNLKNS